MHSRGTWLVVTSELCRWLREKPHMEVEQEGGPGRPVLPLPGSEGRKMPQELGKGGTSGFVLQLAARVPAEVDTAQGAGRKGAGERLRNSTGPVKGQQRRAGALLAAEMKFTARLSARQGGGGASWERDGAGECGSLAFCSHRRGKAVSFAGLIGLMRFPYSSLRGCQQAWLACHFPLLTAYPLCKRRGKGNETGAQIEAARILPSSVAQDAWRMLTPLLPPLRLSRTS